MYCLLPTHHIYIEVTIIFLVSECLLPCYVKFLCVSEYSADLSQLVSIVMCNRTLAYNVFLQKKFVHINKQK